MNKMKATALLIVVLISQPFSMAAQTQTAIKEQLDEIPDQRQLNFSKNLIVADQ